MASNRYNFTKKAETDIDEVIEYIAVSLCNPQAANDLLDEIEKAIGNALAFPEMYQFLDNELVNSEGLRKINVGNYVLLYLYDQNNSIITILRFVYGRRNLERLLSELLK